MEIKNLRIIAAVAIVVVLGGVISISNNSFDTVDKLAVDYNTIDSLLRNDENLFVVDIRTVEQYENGHIVGASHDILTSEVIEKRVNTIQTRLPEISSTYDIVLVDDDGINSKYAAQTMTGMGIKTFYLDGGMNNYSGILETSSQTTITPRDLFQRLSANEDLFLLDVREPDELLESKIDGSVNIPLAEIFEPNGINEIPTNKQVIVICGSGNRATIATYALAQENLDFQVLEGGIKAWNSLEFSESNS